MVRRNFIYRVTGYGDIEPSGRGGTTKAQAYRKARMDAAVGDMFDIWRRDANDPLSQWENTDSIHPDDPDDAVAANLRKV